MNRTQHHLDDTPTHPLRRPPALPPPQPQRIELGSTYKRCGCREPLTGRPLDTFCPLLRWSDHGSWYFYLPLPTVDGRRHRIRRGGYETESDARAALLAETELAEQAGLITRRPHIPDPAFQIHLDHQRRVPRKTTWTRFGVRRGVRIRDQIRPSLVNRRKDSS
jgi:hypothetical protein